MSGGYTDGMFRFVVHVRLKEGERAGKMHRWDAVKLPAVPPVGTIIVVENIEMVVRNIRMVRDLPWIDLNCEIPKPGE